MAGPHDEYDMEQILEIARRRTARAGQVPPSEEVLESYISEWDKAMAWMTPYLPVIDRIARGHNEHFMLDVVETGTLDDDALAAHVTVVVRLAIHRLLLLGAIQRTSEDPADPAMDLLEQILNPPEEDT